MDRGAAPARRRAADQRAPGARVRRAERPRPDAATDALLDLAREVRSLGIPIVVTDTAGRITALDNAPPTVGGDTARLRAWITQLDVENAPVVQPGVARSTTARARRRAP